MSETLTLPLCNRQQAWAAITKQVFPFLAQNLQAGRELMLSVKPKTRSLEQNARMWAMLSDIAAQVDWHGKKLGAEDWKAVFTASLKGMNVVPNLDNTGFVVLGQSTSRMSIRDMVELQDLMEAFGAEKGVRFSAPEGWEDAR